MNFFSSSLCCRGELYTTQNKQHKFFHFWFFFLHTETEKKGQNIGKFKVFFFVNLFTCCKICEKKLFH